MGANVFANGREVSAKANGNQSIAAMPDVCLSPPPPPAGPLPIPYPNTSEADKTHDGSKSVKIGGKEVGLKNKSDYKKSQGNEAATRNFGMGVVSHNLSGPVQHAAWSFNVKFEDENAIRHLDLTTGNHSNPSNFAITADVASMAPTGPSKSDCKELSAKNKELRKEIRSRQQKSLRRAGGRNTTITHGKYLTPNGATGGIRAASRALIAKYDNSFAKGLKRSGGKSEATKVSCSAAKQKNFKYTNTLVRPHTSHTESRIIEDIFRARGPQPGGHLLLSIHWNSGGKIKNVPCDDCQRLICAAMACGLQISLCKKGNKPAEQDQDDCPPDLSGSA